MRSRDGAGTAPGRAPRFVGVAAGTALLLGAAAIAPVAAQDGTPTSGVTGSPVAIASPAARSVDCAVPLGLEPGGACVLIAHAAGGAPDVDVLVDGDARADGLAFGTASPFVAVEAGEHRVQVVEAGASPEDALLDLTLTFEAGLAYEIATLTRDDGLTAAILSTNLDPLEEERARVRVFQTIPGAPPAEVAVAGGETVIDNVEYGSATGYVEVPAGETPIDLEVRVSGLPVAFPIAGAELEPGTVSTFYAVGDIADPASLGVLPIVVPVSGSAGAGTQGPAVEPIPLTPGTPAAPATPTV